MKNSKSKLRLKLIKSLSGRLKNHIACASGLGLRKINQVVEIEATPENMGMVNKIRYLLEIEEITNAS